MTAAGAVLQTLVYSGFIALLVALWFKEIRKKQGHEPVRDGPSDEPYRVFTRQFDVELPGVDLERKLLGSSPDYQNGWYELGKNNWRGEVKLANELLERERDAFKGALGDLSSLCGSAVTILIDQSGSMRDGPMRWAAVASRLAIESLSKHGCIVELLGFSTAGWQGGFSYQKWQSQGRPKRPGRLCALLHVIYKASDEEGLPESNWEALLNPNILRENVDGEALEWASQRLRSSSAQKKYLIVLSDGAAVDDATIKHNGLAYLDRHCRQVIARLEQDHQIELSAIGIRYPADEYYSTSATVDDVTQLPKALAEWISRLVENAS